MTNEVQKHGFACAQGNCLRNAFLITMGWNYAGFLPQRKEGYSLGMLASRLADAGFEFEYIYASITTKSSQAQDIVILHQGFVDIEHPNSPNVLFCTGFDETGTPHAWALITNVHQGVMYLVDAAKHGVILLMGAPLFEVLSRITQVAIIAKDGKFTPNTGANFVRNLGNLPVLFSQ